jgi:hypothetical protein
MLAGEGTSRMVRNGSVVSIVRVVTNQDGDDEKTAPDFAEATSRHEHYRASPKF